MGGDGWQMIDDDVGMLMASGFEGGEHGDRSAGGEMGTNSSASHVGPPVGPVWMRDRPSSTLASEDFPSLQAGAVGGGGGGGGAWGSTSNNSGLPSLGGGTAGNTSSLAAASAAAIPSHSSARSYSRAPPQLVKVVVKCPCGKRQRQLAVLEGGDPPAPLACDRACESAQRQQQLADAFDADPDQACYWDRHRTPHYPATLLHATQSNPAFILSLESDMEGFMRDGAAQRKILGAMPSAQRQVVHEYAQVGWGLSSHSVGHEPNRRVNLFKVPTSGTPALKLSYAAQQYSAEEVKAMAEAQKAEQQSADAEVAIRLMEIQPGTGERER
jgi:hypothetical protein